MCVLCELYWLWLWPHELAAHLPSLMSTSLYPLCRELHRMRSPRKIQSPFPQSCSITRSRHLTHYLTDLIYLSRPSQCVCVLPAVCILSSVLWVPCVSVSPQVCLLRRFTHVVASAAHLPCLMSTSLYPLVALQSPFAQSR